MKWIGQHIWDLTSRFRNTISIGEDSIILTNIDQSTNDISTWQLQPKSFTVSAQEATPEAVFFKPDGTKMYILGRSGDDVGEYALSTAWDISTASYTDALTGLGSSPASEPNPYGMYISPDGIYLYIVGHSTDQVVQYTMSTAWDVSTASYTREQALTDSGGSYANPNGIHFKPDGTMFWVCSSSEDTIQQYTLSTAWDVSTLSTGYSFSLIDFFILNDLSGATPNADIGSSEDLFFSEDGTKVWFVENGYDSVHQLKLSIAWDMSTAAYDGKGIRVSMYESVVEGLYVNEAAGKAFTVSSSSDIVRSFNIGGAVFSSANNASVGFDSGIGVKGNASFSGKTSFVDITAQAGYFYGGFATYSTSSIVHGNGGTTNINDGTTYSGDATLDVMTNVYYGANAADLSVQDTYIHNINLGRPRGGAKVTLNIGRRVGGSGTIANHTGIMDVVSMAQTFDHYGSLDVGRTLQVDGKADLEVFDLGGTVVFNDTFTETNTTAIESHTPDLGAGWTKVFDTGATTTLNIIGGAGYGQLSNSETSDGVMFLADTTPTGVDYEVRVDFKRRDSGDDVFLIIIKYKDANNYYALQWSASYSTYCKLFRVEGGSVVNIESNFSYGAMSSTADNLSTALKLRFIDNTLMVWDIDSNDYKSFRGSYPVTTDFNDGSGGTYHKVGMAFGDLFGGGLDATTTWKVDKFEVKMLSSAATFAAATKSYIDAGNFGVGITNPTSKFHVVGDARIQGNLTVNGTYTQIDTDVNTTEQWLVTNDGTGPAAVINQKGSQDIFDVQDDGTSVFYIKDGGNVGIGTTSPNKNLTVEWLSNNTVITQEGLGGGTAGSGVLIQNGSFVANTYANLDFRAGNADGRIAYKYNSINDGDFHFITDNGNSPETKLFIKNNGKVGIGTTNPLQELQVDGSIYANGGDLYVNGGKALISVGDLLFKTFESGAYHERARILANGNVGIGTASPGQKLEVDEGYINVTGAGTSHGYELERDGLDTYRIRHLDGGLTIQNSTDSRKEMTFDGAGNVGIGTNSPAAQLHVMSPDGNTDSLRVGRADTNNFWRVNHAGADFRLFNQASSGSDILLGVDAGGTAQANKVGIGTATPAVKLDVAGDAQLQGTAPRFVMKETGSNKDFSLRVQTDGRLSVLNDNLTSEVLTIKQDGNVGIGTTNPGELFEVYKNGGDVAIKVHEDAGTHEAKLHLRRGGSDWELINNNDLAIESEGTELFRIKTTGNVGIGTTTPVSTLDVNGTIRSSGGSLLVEDTDSSSIHGQINSNSTEGVLRLRNGSNWGMIARGISNSPRLGAYHNGYLSIYGFGAVDGADHADDDELARFDFANERFIVNGQISVGGNITTSSNSYIVSSRKFTARDANGTGLFADDAASGLSIADDGDATFTGDLTVNGVNYGAYHSVNEDQYYFDDYNGRRNLAFFYKNARADIIRYQPVDNFEYWNGSAWVADSSQESNVKKLLDGRQDTRWDVTSTYYKFRFTTQTTTSWPTMAMIWMQTSWSGSTWPGATMLVEEYDGSSWATKVTAEFTNTNGVTNWGLSSRADTALHTGNGHNADTTRITVDFYGWTPSNGSYTTIPLQNLMITSNYAGTENTDYTNLLSHDKHLRLGDNRMLVFGDGDDLQIYHDGSNSVIDDAGTGNLKIRSNRLQLEKYTGETMAEFIADGSSSLYYDNNKKLETTSTGVEVTGDLTVNGDSVQTKQMVVTTHNFQMANTTGTFFYVPFNNLNESSAATSAEYWTRSIAPYAGTIKKVIVRSHTSLGSSCQIRVSKITDTTDDLPSGTHVTNTGIDISTANNSVSTTMSTNAFAEGDVVGVALSRSAGSSARVVVTIVWEYTV